MDCYLLILTYNNFSNLNELLPTVKSLIESSEAYRIGVKVIQNGECNDSQKLVQSKYKYEYISSDNNYLFSYNEIVKRIDSEFVLILNDDLRLGKSLLNEILPLFKLDKKLFAVSCLFYDWGTKNVQLSGSSVNIKNGWMKVFHHQNLPTESQYCFYTSGGASVYRTKMFNELSGFDRIYWPAYYEDGDLCHRAWNMGWHSAVNPKAIVEHRAGVSWKKSKQQNRIVLIQLRNKMIGMLVNIESKIFFISFCLLLPYRLLFSMLFQHNSFKAYLMLLRNAISVIKTRKRNLDTRRMPDNYMLSLIGKRLSS